MPHPILQSLTPLQQEILYKLQRPLPLVHRPFEQLALQLHTTEQAILSLIEQLRQAQLVRRIGGVFDARRLGYQSCLFAIHTTPQTIDTIAKRICAMPAVTHAYTRGWPQDFSTPTSSAADYAAYPDFWYTLSAHRDQFQACVDTLKDLNPIPFPAITRFKIDVVFDTRNRSRDERTEYTPPPSDAPENVPLSPKQIALIQAFQQDLATTATPFTQAAQQAGWSEEDALSQLTLWQSTGVMRRLSLLLYHRATGFSANGMCCWLAPEDQISSIGRSLAQAPEVTHCYQRPTHDDFPFNLYAMIHETSFQGAMETFHFLSKQINLTPGKIFFSTKEFKKTSLQFFIDPINPA